MNQILRYCLCWCLANNFLFAQQVSISPEVQIKNDFSYFYFPHPDGNISLLRDKSFRLSLQTLFPDFSWSTEKNLLLRGKKWKIINIHELGNSIEVFYLTQEDGHHLLVEALYNQQGNVLRERILFAGSGLEDIRNYQSELSENQAWMALLLVDQRGDKTVMVYERRQDSLYCKKTLHEWDQFKSEWPVKEYKIANDGNIYIHTLIDSETDKKEKLQECIVQLNPHTLGLTVCYLPLGDLKLFESQFIIDNINHQVLYGGLYSDKQERYPEGYFLIQLNERNEMAWKKLIPFSRNMLQEWKGESNLKSIFRDGAFKLQEMTLAMNGSCLMFFEFTREISRRPYFTSMDPSNNLASRWFDYYFDDILVAHFDANGQVQWEQILHKRQYSQDDDGIFSSFYVFHLPALLRIVFNDAVNADGTVSEYLLKPNGDNIRKSVLNTSYKNLNLRFQDALTTGPNEMLLPSESNGKLTLVKIQFN